MDLPIIVSITRFRVWTCLFSSLLPCLGSHSPLVNIRFRSLQKAFKSLLMFYPGRLERMTLLTVEVEVNRDSKSTNERGSSLVISLGLSCWYKRYLFSSRCSRGQLQNNFFLHFFNFFIPIAQQAGRAAVLGRLSLSTDLS